MMLAVMVSHQQQYRYMHVCIYSAKFVVFREIILPPDEARLKCTESVAKHRVPHHQTPRILLIRWSAETKRSPPPHDAMKERGR
mmetsp:Transcript_84600/g.155081  ORF Transcript_84600/g.155081 Transcript_84600/m.155081 type:complete len:84 (+) Transcript_84600:1-252(+)